MTTPRDPNKAIQFLIDNAPKFAQAKASRVYVEQFLKSKRALLMNESAAKTANEREAYAYAHADYIQLLDGLKVAVEQEETLKWQLTAAEAAIEVWRSMEATARSEVRATR